MGVAFAKRGKRTDECIEIVRGHRRLLRVPAQVLRAPDRMTGATDRYRSRSVAADAALRRAARADGWIMAAAVDGTRPNVAEVKRLREEAENQPVRNPRDLPGRFHRGRRQAAQEDTKG